MISDAELGAEQSERIIAFVALYVTQVNFVTSGGRDMIEVVAEDHDDGSIIVRRRIQKNKPHDPLTVEAFKSAIEEMMKRRPTWRLE